MRHLSHEVRHYHLKEDNHQRVDIHEPLSFYLSVFSQHSAQKWQVLIYPLAHCRRVHPILYKVRQGIEKLIKHRPEADHQYKQYSQTAIAQCFYNVQHRFFYFSKKRLAIALCHFRFFVEEQHHQ